MEVDLTALTLSVLAYALVLAIPMLKAVAAQPTKTRITAVMPNTPGVLNHAWSWSTNWAATNHQQIPTQFVSRHNFLIIETICVAKLVLTLGCDLDQVDLRP